MRFLFGIIVGVALTVGVAFISDNWTTGPATTTGSSSSTLEHGKWSTGKSSTITSASRGNVSARLRTEFSHKIAS